MAARLEGGRHVQHGVVGATAPDRALARPERPERDAARFPARLIVPL